MKEKIILAHQKVRITLEQPNIHFLGEKAYSISVTPYIIDVSSA
jgi:hypothetical protein